MHKHIPTVPLFSKGSFWWMWGKLKNSCQILSDKKNLLLQITYQEIKVNHRKHFLIFVPIIWDIFLNQNIIIWTLNCWYWKAKISFFWLTSKLLHWVKALTQQSQVTLKRLVMFCQSSHPQEPWSGLSFILDKNNLTKWKSNKE